MPLWRRSGRTAWTATVEAYRELLNTGRLTPLDSRAEAVPVPLPSHGEQALAVFAQGHLTFARFAAAAAQPTGPGSPHVVVGSPAFLTGYLVTETVLRGRARRRARRHAAAQWRPAVLLRAVLTTHRLWCEVAEAAGPRWVHFNLDTIARLELHGDELVLGFGQVEPLRLGGDWAPWCAAVIAWHRFGPHAPQVVPQLHAAATR
ncbi:hypothetical protein SUDANB95_07889 (plasmid) [Actinosynnema sp. ALI-1.44]